MNWYTSYYAKVRNARLPNTLFVRVSKSRPDWFLGESIPYEKLYPSWKIIMDYKEGRISWEEYTESYTREVLNNLDKVDIIWELEKIAEA